MIFYKVRSLARRELKIRPQGGERANTVINWEIKESFPQKESVERLISLSRSFQGKMNHVACLEQILNHEEEN